MTAKQRAQSALATASLALVLTVSCGGASCARPPSSPAPTQAALQAPSATATRRATASRGPAAGAVAAPPSSANAAPSASPAPPAADRDKDRDSCLLYGTGYLIAAVAPAGWRILCGDDLPRGRRELAVVVPATSAGAPGIAAPYMYFTIEALPKGETLDRFVADENQRVRASAPDAGDAPAVSASGELATGDGERVPVWLYSQASSRRYELTAFAPHGSMVLLVSVTAGTQRDLDALRDRFRELLRATRFVSSNVQSDAPRGSAPAAR